MKDQIVWQGMTANTALSSVNRKTFSSAEKVPAKRIQASGPASGTWTATVKVYRSEDNKKDVLASTLDISNETPSAMDELISTCTYWNYSIESVTGTIPTTEDSDGQSAVTVTVGG
jgi:hypothetical protein